MYDVMDECTIYREDVREYGFSVIVDSRHSNWHSTKQILHSLQEVLPGQVHTVHCMTVHCTIYIYK